MSKLIYILQNTHYLVIPKFTIGMSFKILNFFLEHDRNMNIIVQVQMQMN